MLPLYIGPGILLVPQVNLELVEQDLEFRLSAYDSAKSEVTIYLYEKTKNHILSHIEIVAIAGYCGAVVITNLATSVQKRNQKYASRLLQFTEEFLKKSKYSVILATDIIKPETPKHILLKEGYSVADEFYNIKTLHKAYLYKKVINP